MYVDIDIFKALLYKQLWSPSREAGWIKRSIQVTILLLLNTYLVVLTSTRLSSDAATALLQKKRKVGSSSWQICIIYVFVANNSKSWPAPYAVYIYSAN